VFVQPGFRLCPDVVDESRKAKSSNTYIYIIIIATVEPLPQFGASQRLFQLRQPEALARQHEHHLKLLGVEMEGQKQHLGVSCGIKCAFGMHEVQFQGFSCCRMKVALSSWRLIERLIPVALKPELSNQKAVLC